MSQQDDRAGFRLDAPPETVDDDPPLHAVVASRLVAVTPQTPVRTALDLMLAHDVHHLPVFAGPHCIGLVTESDLLRGVAAQWGPLGPAVLTVAEVHGPVAVLPSSAPLSAAAAAMAADGRDAVLVADGDRIDGIVTASDVVGVVARRAGARRRTAPLRPPS
ncbi:CBS domain-containing protein [Pseudonocardia sp. ICBG1122]|nr:CBS domain-containing protein [Pseudonocardia pini]